MIITRDQLIKKDETTLARTMWDITQSPWHVNSNDWNWVTGDSGLIFEAPGYQTSTGLHMPHGAAVAQATAADNTGKPGSGGFRAYQVRRETGGPT